MENQNLFTCHDKGYSFCNCRNIFYTDWKNIRKDIYDELYLVKYQDANVKFLTQVSTERHWAKVKHLFKNPKTLLELSSVNETIFQLAAKDNIVCTTLDLIDRNCDHDHIVTDFEEYTSNDKYDIIWASHIFEHFHYPGKALEKCKDMLTENGCLVVSMPDTIFCNFKYDIENWAWVVEEHYILWNMYNWIEYAEEHGLKCVYSERTYDLDQEPSKDWRAEFEQLTVFRRASGRSDYSTPLQ